MAAADERVSAAQLSGYRQLDAAGMAAWAAGDIQGAAQAWKASAAAAAAAGHSMFQARAQRNVAVCEATLRRTAGGGGGGGTTTTTLPAPATKPQPKTQVTRSLKTAATPPADTEQSVAHSPIVQQLMELSAPATSQEAALIRQQMEACARLYEEAGSADEIMVEQAAKSPLTLAALDSFLLSRGYSFLDDSFGPNPNVSITSTATASIEVDGFHPASQSFVLSPEPSFQAPISDEVERDRAELHELLLASRAVAAQLAPHLPHTLAAVEPQSSPKPRKSTAVTSLAAAAAAPAAPPPPPPPPPPPQPAEVEPPAPEPPVSPRPRASLAAMQQMQPDDLAQRVRAVEALLIRQTATFANTTAAIDAAMDAALRAKNTSADRNLCESLDDMLLACQDIKSVTSAQPFYDSWNRGVQVPIEVKVYRPQPQQPAPQSPPLSNLNSPSEEARRRFEEQVLSRLARVESMMAGLAARTVAGVALSPSSPALAAAVPRPSTGPAPPPPEAQTRKSVAPTAAGQGPRRASIVLSQRLASIDSSNAPTSPGSSDMMLPEEFDAKIEPLVQSTMSAAAAAAEARAQAESTRQDVATLTHRMSNLVSGVDSLCGLITTVHANASSQQAQLIDITHRLDMLNSTMQAILQDRQNDRPMDDMSYGQQTMSAPPSRPASPPVAAPAAPLPPVPPPPMQPPPASAEPVPIRPQPSRQSAGAMHERAVMDVVTGSKKTSKGSLLARINQQRTMDILARSPAFNNLSESELLLLYRNCDEREVPDGQFLCRQGDYGASMFIVVEGSVSILVKRTDAPGERQLVRRYPGQIVGEFSLMSPGPRSASLQCIGTTRVLELAASSFKALRNSQHKGTALRVALNNITGHQAVDSAFANLCMTFIGVLKARTKFLRLIGRR